MKQKLSIVLALIVVVVILGGIFAYKNSKTSTNTATSTPTASSNEKASDNQMAKTVDVTLTSQGFVPSTITINAGTKVIWTNNSGAEATVNSDPHPIHTDYSPLNLGQFKNGEKLELVFDKAGTFKYHNHLNPSDKGTVIVK